jgi:hypothetical protein
MKKKKFRYAYTLVLDDLFLNSSIQGFEAFQGFAKKASCQTSGTTKERA